MKAVRMYAPRDLRVEEVEIPSYEAVRRFRFFHS